MRTQLLQESQPKQQQHYFNILFISITTTTNYEIWRQQDNNYEMGKN